jgi:hypothetical protein
MNLVCVLSSSWGFRWAGVYFHPVCFGDFLPAQIHPAQHSLPVGRVNLDYYWLIGPSANLTFPQIYSLVDSDSDTAPRFSCCVCTIAGRRPYSVRDDRQIRAGLAKWVPPARSRATILCPPGKTIFFFLNMDIVSWQAVRVCEEEDWHSPALWSATSFYFLARIRSPLWVIRWMWRLCSYC